jgi:hypothetical protein
LTHGKKKNDEVKKNGIGNTDLASFSFRCALRSIVVEWVQEKAQAFVR